MAWLFHRKTADSTSMAKTCVKCNKFWLKSKIFRNCFWNCWLIFFSFYCLELSWFFFYNFLGFFGRGVPNILPKCVHKGFCNTFIPGGFLTKDFSVDKISNLFNYSSEIRDLPFFFFIFKKIFCQWCCFCFFHKKLFVFQNFSCCLFCWIFGKFVCRNWNYLSLNLFDKLMKQITFWIFSLKNCYFLFTFISNVIFHKVSSNC